VEFVRRQAECGSRRDWRPTAMSRRSSLAHRRRGS
jgi:hypothetical protein